MKIFASVKDNLQNICDNAKPFDTIVLKQGVYRQKFEINTPNLTIVGENPETVEVVFDDCANKIHADGREFNTFRTYTVAVCASGVKMRDLTIKNSTVDPKTKGQCVALSVCAGDFEMQNCKLKSTQDTLFCGPLPDDLVLRYVDFLPDKLRIFDGVAVQKFTNCEIVGSVDFIFGCGNAVFCNCQIVSVNDGRNLGYVAAPAHSLEQTAGFEFFDCQFLAKDGVEPNSIYLARPWRDFGKCTFTNCTFGQHIKKNRFCGMFGGVDRTSTMRFEIV